MKRQEYDALNPEERIGCLARVEMPYREKAEHLLHHCPSRNSDILTFRDFIDDVVGLAESIKETEGAEKLRQYFGHDIRPALIDLEAALVALACPENSRLGHNDKRSLSLVKALMVNVSNGCKVFENEQKEMLRNARVAVEAGDTSQEVIFDVAQDGYSYFRRMQLYARDVGDVVSSINNDLGIIEPPDRKR